MLENIWFKPIRGLEDLLFAWLVEGVSISDRSASSVSNEELSWTM